MREKIKDDKYYDILKDIEIIKVNSKPINFALVLEGGAFRGLYQEGVLDCLLKNNIIAKTTIGVSAGALNGINYVACQSGRSAHINLRYRHNKDYVGINAFIKTRGVINLDFAFGELEKIPPLDMDEVKNPNKDLYVVATNMKTGKAEYFKNDREDILTCVRASATLPYISKPVQIGDDLYFDGGCDDRIPYKFAKELGYDKIIIIRTRDRNFRCKKNFESRYKITKRWYSNYPDFSYNLAKTDENYNDLCDEIDNLENAKELFVICPSKPINIKMLEGNLPRLKELYALGYFDCLNLLNEIKKYLNIN